MPIVGLTGGIGSGKSSVLPFFEKYAIPWVDMDIVAREVVQPDSPALKKIDEYFRTAIPNILLPDGSLNRSALRAHIFESPSSKYWLEGLLHPLIRTTTYQQLEARGDMPNTPYSLLVSPLLVEKKFPVNATIVIDVPQILQIQRASQRDSASAESIRAIIKQQLPSEERLEAADFVIDNSGSLINTEHQVSKIHHQLLKYFSI